MATLSSKVQVSERFQRSIRIDTDIGDEGVINSFICPQSSIEVLLSMAKGRQEAGEAAFTWTGPFGSGKSSLVVALSALLGNETRLRTKAEKVVGEKNAAQILKGFGVSPRKGWTFIPVVGSRGNVADAIISAVKASTKTKRQITPSSLVETLTDMSKQEDCGLFIVLDEMGKFLEGAGEGNSDIYLFQQLAEVAARSKGKIVILGILHQAFAEYARRLTRDVRDEWTKIQGRFVDLPLNVAGEELIDLVGRAIKSDKKPSKSDVAKTTAEHIEKWRRVNIAVLSRSLAQCWPLHPVAAALLGPISRRRFGQNQRSVFGFLNSAEPYGFQDFLKNAPLSDDSLYAPARLWDYLKANLEPSIMASPDGHKWSLAVDALFRAEAAGNDKKALETLKCVALMDLFQERSGLSPDKDLLATCLLDVSKKELNQILEKLSSQSVICYRNHKRSYSLHQGSDFDIDSATEEAYKQTPVLDFDRIRKASRFQPVVAKKHYHETGALRWLDVDLVPAEQAEEVARTYEPKDGAIGLVMVVIGTSEAGDINKICRIASGANSKWPVFVSAAQNSGSIRNHARELQALEWIRGNNPTLGGDTVARREVDSRAAKIRDSLEEHLSTTLAAGKWFLNGENAVSLTFRELHAKASEKADELYPKSPKINSELVNRIKPSSNSVAALKELMNAMISKQGQKRLGIEGYPAEGGLFQTLLDYSALYTETDDGFVFTAPTDKRQDRARLRPLWDAADKFFEKNQNRAVPITELYSVWTSRPYGVKNGLLPFLALAYLMTRPNGYAVYHAGYYRPSIDNLFIDYLTKVPGEISLRSMNFSDIGQKILAGTASTLNRIHPSLAPLSETSEPLAIARRLVMTVMDLPPWVLRTRQLSDHTIRLRELIKNANDPNKVLFDDLPKLFKEYEENLNKGDVQPIIGALEESLQEMVSAYPRLMSDLRQQLLEELQIEGKGHKALEELNKRAKNILQISGDFKLDAFAARLSAFKDTEADLEGLMSLAADKPTRDWIDLDVNRAKLRIAELSQQFNHIEAFGRVQNREDYREAISFMVGLNGKPKTFVREFTVKKTQQEIVQEVERQLYEILTNKVKANDDLMLAVLANLGARILDKDHLKPKKKAN